MHTTHVAKMTKTSSSDKNQHLKIYSTLASVIRASRWTQTSMPQWNEVKSISEWTFWYIICMLHEMRYSHGDMGQWTGHKIIIEKGLRRKWGVNLLRSRVRIHSEARLDLAGWDFHQVFSVKFLCPCSSCHNFMTVAPFHAHDISKCLSWCALHFVPLCHACLSPYWRPNHWCKSAIKC